MATAIITRGIPASGKTTWATAWVAESPDTRGRVNRDDIRMSVFGKGHGVDERVITRVQDATIRALASQGMDVVVDNTNLNPRHGARLSMLLTSLGYVVEVRDFDVTVAEAIARDARRDRPVGADVIISFHERYRVAS